MDKIIKISVRNIVEFALKSGSIDSGFFGRMTAAEGTLGHKTLQKLRSSIEGYRAELPVAISVEEGGIQLEISGRLDGIYVEAENIVIEEIKTTERALDNIDENYNLVHWAQAKLYAYIYGLQNNLNTISIQLTYYHRRTKEIKSFLKNFQFSELEDYFEYIVNRYMKFAVILNDWSLLRNDTIQRLDFPFEKYRKGQREFAVAVYKSICEGKKIYAEAPTGIGKTMAAIFPGIKALGEGQIAKIFYLTAKTSTRAIAEEAFENLRKQGLKFKTVTITAKEKVCPQDKISCKPEDCNYARGYYDRIDEATLDIMKVDHYNRETIFLYAKKHSVCPFEFSLDLALFSDGIICDYNYVFDPRVYLKRFFMELREDYGFLIDEAHNLVDRAREMYSSELLKSRFLELKTEIKKEYPKVKKSISEINAYFIKLRRACEESSQSYIKYQEQFKDINPYLEDFINAAEELLSRNTSFSSKEKLLELYFDTLNYIKISELYDDKYITYIEKNGNDIRIKMFCLDPSRLLGEGMKRGKSSILYSATLSPLEYFVNILGGGETDYKIKIKSPFDQDRLCLMIADNINTQYNLREFSYKSVAQYIYTLINIRSGNYFVFFPSYKYLKEVYTIFTTEYAGIKTTTQKSGMTDLEREGFLEEFTKGDETGLVAFAVMGGVFGEGIDLTGDKLIGAIIVGVGLPQICLERDIIKEYFSNLNHSGFEYSYVYPGMNKVLQAAGRVIRTEKDKGIVFLIDERFSRMTYKKLMPPAWENIHWVRNEKQICSVVEKFWR